MTKDEYDSAYFLGEMGDWTGDLVWLRFLEAINTLRRLPEKWRPQSVRSAALSFQGWMDEEFAGVEPAEDYAAKEPPSKQAITRMEEVLRWHADWLTSPRAVEWGRAIMIYAEAYNGRFRLKKACEKIGVSPPTLLNRKEIAKFEVSEKLVNNATEILMPDYELCLLLAVK